MTVESGSRSLTLTPDVEAKIEETLEGRLEGFSAELRAAFVEHEVQQAAARRKADESSDNGEIKQMLRAILEGPPDDDPMVQAVVKKRRRRNWLAVALTLLGGGSGGGAWYVTQDTGGKAGVPVETRVRNLETSVRGCEAGKDCSEGEAKASLKGVTDLNSKKADRLGDLHMSQRGLVIDVRDEVMASQKKIADKLHVELDPVESEPDSVAEARVEVKAYKNLKASEKAEAARKKGDPFADL